MAIRVGISGWRYPPWRGVFYPPGLAQARELAFAAQHFATIELNGSFYSLQRPEFYACWRAETPPDFVFALKGGRFITHMKKLKEVDTALANFFASGVLALREKLGPVLWQFPDTMPADLERFERFFSLLPRDTVAAAKLARTHGRQVAGRSLTACDARRPIRHAVELRNPAAATSEFLALLQEYDMAAVIADTAGRWSFFEDITSDFVYVRLHGDKKLYENGYSQRAIAHWAARIQCWHRGGEPQDATRIGRPARPQPAGRDVYVYFDNDMKVHAPFDALTLQRTLGLDWAAGSPLRNRRRPGKARG